MLELLNNKYFDNERNILNADLFVSNLKNTLKAFKFNTKITYEVYRNVTIYHISWNDDKTYEDITKLKREISLALGITREELEIKKINDNEVQIIVQNMKKDTLSLKELLTNFKKDNNFKVALGLDEKDNIITFNFDRDKSLLVTGVSGIGKTNLFRNIIMNILINYHDTKILILDSQGINYNDFNKVCEVVNDEKEIIKRIKSLRSEFENRVKTGNKERLVVFIDEIYEILEIDNSIDEDINYLLELGSMMNIHLIVSTDTISTKDISRIFSNDNIAKLSFYQTSRGEYNIFLNSIVKNTLNNDGMYLNIDKELTRITIPLIEDDEISRVVTKLEKK